MNKIFILILCLSSSLFAQDKFTVSGFVKELSSSEELIGANIVCEDLSIGATTNSYGFYSISLPKGTYSIRYSFIGYKDKVVEVSMTEDKRLDVALELYTEELNEIVIEDEAQQKVRSIEMSVNRLETKAVKQLAAVGGEVDIIKSIQLLPGVTSVGEGANGFNVRGGAADENLVLLDEMTLYNASHLFGFFSVFNADAIKDMKLYKGGIPAEYGSRISSVLDVRQKEGNSNFTEASGGIGLISSRLMVEGPLWDKSSFMVAGRRSYGDLFLALSNDSTIRDNKLYFYDLNMKLNSWLGEKDRLFLSSYMGRDAFKFGSLFASSWGNETVNLRWLHLFSDRVVSNLSYNFNDYDYLISILPEGFEFDWESKIKNHQLKYDVSYFHSNEHQIKGGLSVNKYHFEPGIIEPATDSSSIVTFNMRDKFAYETALFVQDEWKVSERLLVKAGLRWSSFHRMGADTILVYEDDAPIRYDSMLGQYVNGEVVDSLFYGPNDVVKSYSNLEPRLSVRYQIDESRSVKASYQKINQYLHLITNASSPTPLDIWAPSGPFIKPLVGQQYALGYFYTSDNQKWELSSELYYKNLDNVIDYVDAADLEFNNHLETEILYGQGRAYGLEFMLEKKLGKLTGWMSYTFAKTESIIPGNGLGEPGINHGDWYPNPQDKTHDLSLVAFYKLNSKWSFSSNFVYATGIPTNYPVAKYEFEGIMIPHYSGSRNQERLENYHRLDFAATYKPRGNDLREWVFSIYNAYNRKNASSLYFRESIDNLGQTEAVQLSIFPIVPSVSYNFRF
jgi:hypothetical protein